MAMNEFIPVAEVMEPPVIQGGPASLQSGYKKSILKPKQDDAFIPVEEVSERPVPRTVNPAMEHVKAIGKELAKSALATAGGAVKGVFLGAPDTEKSRVFGPAMAEYPDQAQMGSALGGIVPLVASGGATAPLETAVIAGTKAIPSTVARFALGKAAHGAATFGIPAFMRGVADVVGKEAKLSEAAKGAVLETATGAALGLTGIPESTLTRYLSNAAIGLTSSAIRKDSPVDAAFNTGLFVVMQAVNDRSVMPEIRQYARNQARSTVSEFIKVKHPDIVSKYGENGVQKMSDAIIEDAVSVFPEGKPITARDFDKMNGVVRTRLNNFVRDLNTAEAPQRAEQASNVAKIVGQQVSKNTKVIADILRSRAVEKLPSTATPPADGSMAIEPAPAPKGPIIQKDQIIETPEGPRLQRATPPLPTKIPAPGSVPMPMPAEIPARVPAIEEAAKHGKVVGIDAETKLPLIDTKQAPEPTEPMKAGTPAQMPELPAIKPTSREHYDDEGNLLSKPEAARKPVTPEPTIAELAAQKKRDADDFTPTQNDIYLAAMNAQDVGGTKRFREFDYRVDDNGDVEVAHSVTGRVIGTISLKTGEIIPDRTTDKPVLDKLYEKLRDDGRKQVIRQEISTLNRVKDIPERERLEKMLETQKKTNIQRQAELVAEGPELEGESLSENLPEKSISLGRKYYVENLYKKLVFSPALNDNVQFTARGLSYLTRKDDMRDVQRRMQLLPRVIPVLEGASRIDDADIRKVSKNHYRYGLIGRFKDGKVVRVIVDQIQHEGKKFLSVFDVDELSEGKWMEKLGLPPAGGQPGIPSEGIAPEKPIARASISQKNIPPIKQSVKTGEKQGGLLTVYQLTEPVKVKNTQGKVINLPKGETYYAYPKGDGKILLKDGKQVTVFSDELSKLGGQEADATTNPPKGGGMPEDRRAFMDETKKEGKFTGKLRAVSYGYKHGYVSARTEARARMMEVKETNAGIENQKKVVVDYASKVKELPYNQTQLARAIAHAKNEKQVQSIYKLVDRIAEKNARIELIQETGKVLKRWKDSPSVFVEQKKNLQEWGEYFKENAKHLPIEDLQFLHDEITNEMQYGREKFATWKEAWDAKVEDAKVSLASDIKPIESHPRIRSFTEKGLSFSDGVRNYLREKMNVAENLDLALMPMDAIMDLMDGGHGKYTGQHMRMKTAFDRAHGKFLTRREMRRWVNEYAEKNRMREHNFERIGIHAARMQEGGMEKLLQMGLDENEINAVKLTPQEETLYQMMRKDFDSLKEEVKAVNRDVYNQPFKDMENYFSFMTDFKTMDEAESSRWKNMMDSDTLNLDAFGGRTEYRQTKTPEKGFTKTRTGGKQNIKLNALDIYNRHIDDALYMIEMAEPLKKWGSAIWSSEYREVAGDRGTRLMRDWIATMATKGGYTLGQRNSWIDRRRFNLGTATLGLKAVAALIQPTSLFQGASYIGSRAFDGLREIATNRDMRNLVLKMPEIKFRVGDDIAFREMGGGGKAQKVGMWALVNLDKLSAMGVASGAYRMKMAELGLPIDYENLNQEAADFAQLVVRRTQSSPFYKDSPGALERGGSLAKTALQFQSFLLSNWSIIRHDLYRSGIRERDIKKAANIIIPLMLATLAETGVRWTDKQLRGKDTEFWKEYAWEAANNVPILGQLIGAVIYGGVPVPLIDMIASVGEELSYTIKSKKPETKLKHAALTGMAAGRLLGIPGTAQVEQFIRMSGKKNQNTDTSQIQF